jgi:hypothetical protein
VDSNSTSLDGYGGRVIINKNRGQFTFNAALGFLSPGFEVNDLGYSAFSDIINSHFFATYRWTTPTSFYQQAGISAGVFSNYDFGGNHTAQGYRFGSYLNLPTGEGGDFALMYFPQTYNSRLTRGGPLTLNPVSRSAELELFSDGRKWYVLYFYGFIESGESDITKTITTQIEFKVLPTLTVQIGPTLSYEKNAAQWITSVNDPTANQTYGKRYLFADLNQTTLSANIRADWIISPKLSFQVYIQPLIASGSFNNFKALRKAKSFDFISYGSEGSTMQKSDGSYQLDIDGAGPVSPVQIGNPDFNYLSLRGNAVLRWEYRPGSTFYFVWTQSRENVDPDGTFRFGHSFNNLLSIRPDNIFMIKFNYWLGM